MDMLIGLAITLVAQLIYGLGEMGQKKAAAAEAPLTVHEVRAATDEEIAAAAAELPELLRRSQEAIRKPTE